MAIAHWYRQGLRTGLGDARLCGQQIGQHAMCGHPDQREIAFTIHNPLRLQNLEYRLRHLGVTADVRHRLADNGRSYRRGLAELDRRLALCRAPDDADLVGSILPDG